MNNEEQDYEVKIRSTIKQPLISVIIPVYNVQNSGFFSELLSAIDNQGNLLNMFLQTMHQKMSL